MNDDHEDYIPTREDWDDYDRHQREQALEEEWDDLTCHSRFPPFSE